MDIRSRRMELGLSQAELADKVGVSQAQIYYIERGRRKLTLETAMLLAAALGCRVEELEGR